MATVITTAVTPALESDVRAEQPGQHAEHARGDGGGEQAGHRGDADVAHGAEQQQRHRADEHLRGAEAVDRSVLGRREQPAAEERVGEPAGGEHGARDGVATGARERDADQGQDQGQCERDESRPPPGRRRQRDVCQREHEDHGGHGQRAAAGGRATPRPAVSAGTARDGLDHVVVLELGPLGAARHQVQHLAVAHALRGEVAAGLQRRPGRPPQHPAAVALAVVGRALAGVPEDLRKQLGDRDVLREGDVDAPGPGTDRDPGQAGSRRGRHAVTSLTRLRCRGSAPRAPSIRRPPPC